MSIAPTRLAKLLAKRLAKFLGGVLLLSPGIQANAAKIHVVSTGNIRPALFDLQALFERANTDKIVLQIQGAAATQRRILEGGDGDVVIGTRAMLEALQAAGKVKAGSIADVAYSSVGVVVRLGQPTPDISTDEKFKAFLLAADSIAYPDPAKGSLGGNIFASVIQSWGIEDRIKSKSLLVDGGETAAHMVADGKARYGINQIAEMLPVPGLAYLSPPPPSMTDKIIVASGVLSTVREEAVAGANAWISYITGANAVAILKARGMDARPPR